MKKQSLFAALIFFASTHTSFAKTIELIEPVSTSIQLSCVASGCSNELCVNSSEAPVNSTCMWKEEYSCLNKARCETQANGSCGWTYTSDYNECRGVISEPLLSLAPTSVPSITPLSTPLPTHAPRTVSKTPIITPTPVPTVPAKISPTLLESIKLTPTISVATNKYSNDTHKKISRNSISHSIFQTNKEETRGVLPSFYVRIRNYIKSLLPSLLQ